MAGKGEALIVPVIALLLMGQGGGSTMVARIFSIRIADCDKNGA